MDLALLAFFHANGLVTIGCVSVFFLWARASVVFWRRLPRTRPVLLEAWGDQHVLLAVGLALASIVLALLAGIRTLNTFSGRADLSTVPFLLVFLLYLLFAAKVFKSRAGAFEPATGNMTRAWRAFVWSSLAWTAFCLVYGVLL